MSQFKSLVFMVILAALTAGAVAPQAALAAAQTTCPVMGGNLDKNIFADYKGQRVYFCCKGCDAQFNQDPEKYLKKLKDQGVTLQAAPKTKGQSGN